QTIIDGNQEETVIEIRSGESAKITGFTIRNGKDDDGEVYEDYGGGIFILDSSLILKSCVIKNNMAKVGGGIYLKNSNIDIYDCTIKENIARNYGGGILAMSSSVEFYENYRSNIFLNYSNSGADFLLIDSPNDLIIYADTLTVNNPDIFFMGSFDALSFPTDQISIDHLHSKITPIDEDIYVSPQGDDNNDGLTVETPFKTIRQALIHTNPNSDNPHKINLLPGTYSESINGEILPLPLRDYTTIKGSSESEVFLDADYFTEHFFDSYSVNSGIKKITLKNGFQNSLQASIYKWNSLQQQNNKFKLKNVTIKNSDGLDDTNKAIYIGDLDFVMNGVNFENNNTRSGSITNFSNNHLSHKLLNCIFTNNLGTLGIGNNDNATLRDSIQIINSLFFNNYNDNIEWGSGGSALKLNSKSIVDIVNCTFANNTYDQIDNGGCLLIRGSIIDVNIYNSIFYNNSPYNIYVVNQNSWPIGINIDNSLVDNGEESISVQNSNFNYGLNNIDDDPLFMGTNALYPFALSTDSPCIDAGTLYLPVWIEMPEYDLAGNPRVSGESIDMGCYEYTPFASPSNLVIDAETGVLFWSPPNYEYPQSYNLYLNGELIENINQEIYLYDFSSYLDSNQEYIVGVSAVYQNGESIITEIEFVYNPVFGSSNEVPIVENKIINYPNPFGSSSSGRSVGTTIKFTLADEGNVELAIYNIKGRKVKNLMKAYSGRGIFEMQWNGKDNNNDSVSSGTYLIKAELAGEIIATSKIMMVK
ncbi:MAG: choice-of-anchor Q domain-containing protein, partial [Candidatus Cloacimonadales bacterium]